MREFGLEIFVSKWEFLAKHHMAASDAQSMTVSELLELVAPEETEELGNVWLGYTQTMGAPELREAIAGLYPGMRRENVLSLSGAQEGIYATMRVLLTSDDHAIVFVPNYQGAETVPLEICEVTGIPLLEHDEWQIDLDTLRNAIRPETKLISINFPNNPTGATLRGEIYSELIDICREHDLWLFSDEVYRGLELDPGKRMEPAACLYEKGLSLNVMSKAFGLPGLRVGWLVCQKTEFLDRVNKYKNYLSGCCANPSEWLTTLALRHSDALLDRNRAIIAANLELLDVFFEEHADLFEWHRPDGSSVAWPRYNGRDGVEAFCAKVLREESVLILPPNLYRSELLSVSGDRFRIGFGRKNMPDGLAKLSAYLNRCKSDLI